MAALMIQGCGSDVGKSTLVAGLCRVFTDLGLTVRPFKPQNMSNNAAVTRDGGEIGRAQALQAVACRTEPTIHMNPVLLKPESDTGAQLIVQGRMAGRWTAGGYQDRKASLLGPVLESYRSLQAEADLVVVEGAGSPAETNLRAHDIANMGFARAAGVPVALVGDIDRGHVIAALVGARHVLDDADNALIKGFIVNKFRGDPALFDEGRRTIRELTGWRDLGMVPWLPAAARLPSEDAVILQSPQPDGAGRRVLIVAPILSRIANFDDFDPLRLEPGVEVRFIPPGIPIPGDCDLVILPGTKATIADLGFLRTQGWDIDILAHARRGGRVLGICGGYQMLGRRIADPYGVEGAPGEAQGLGLLDIETVMTGEKTLHAVSGRMTAGGARLDGYEMHVGRTTGPDTARSLLVKDDGTRDGAVSASGRIAGAYVHGLFGSRSARAALLGDLTVAATGSDHAVAVDRALDEIAAILRQSLDIDGLLAIAEKGPAL